MAQRRDDGVFVDIAAFWLRRTPHNLGTAMLRIRWGIVRIAALQHYLRIRGCGTRTGWRFDNRRVASGAESKKKKSVGTHSWHHRTAAKSEKKKRGEKAAA